MGPNLSFNVAGYAGRGQLDQSGKYVSWLVDSEHNAGHEHHTEQPWREFHEQQQLQLEQQHGSRAELDEPRIEHEQHFAECAAGLQFVAEFDLSGHEFAQHGSGFQLGQQLDLSGIFVRFVFDDEVTDVVIACGGELA
ncbi:MAG TPA: hypothetical protein VHA14_08865 [Bryobacteraceae bacterium]|nr:hypothetical protein [Bryobacteraceae bacterium]